MEEVMRAIERELEEKKFIMARNHSLHQGSIEMNRRIFGLEGQEHNA